MGTVRDSLIAITTTMHKEPPEGFRRDFMKRVDVGNIERFRGTIRKLR